MLASRSRESRIGKMGCSDRTPTRTSGFDAAWSPAAGGSVKYRLPSPSAAAGQRREPLVAVERAGQRSRPRRRGVANRLVAAELRLEDALAAGQPRQLVLEVADPPDG